MGTEIIVITIAQVLILAYSLGISVARFFMIRLSYMAADYGFIYKLNAVLVLVLSLGIIAWWLYAISAGYKFSLMYILVIHTPLILISVRLLMPFNRWLSLTKSSKRPPSAAL